jgi:hypothetical protein
MTMDATTLNTWQSIGTKPPASTGDPAATAGSRRVYYRNQTGEYAYRHASWGTHGTGVHGFRAYGDANGCDEWGLDNGKRYPADEF